MPAPMPAVRGFTLVELIAVMLIIGITAALVGPRFFSQTTFRDSGFEESFYNQLRYAHDAAVTSGCHVQMQISATGYQAMSDAQCPGGPLPPAFTQTLIDPETGMALAATAPSDLVLSGGLGNLIFAPDGSIRSGSWNSAPFNQLTIQAQGGAVSRSYVLYGLSGYIQ